MSEDRKVRSGAWGGLVLGALLLGATPPGVMAQETDVRWLAWLGCWEAADAGEAADPDADESMVCLRPASGDVGVEMLSVTDGVITSTQIVRADGEMHETENEGCRGWEMGEFSSGSRRVYLRTDHLCEGDVRRATTGLIAMITPDQWLDVRAVEYSGRALAGVVRYRLAPIDKAEAVGLGDIGAGRAMAVRAARMQAASDPMVDDVIDAIQHVDKEAVRAWVAELRRPFELDADQLVRMAYADVPAEVIDVVVAVSFPDRFAVVEDAEVREAAAREGEWPDTGNRSRRSYFWDPFFYSPFGYPGYYGSFGSGYGYGYGSYRPVVVVVEPRDEGVVGRVINGRGYSRGGRSVDGGSAAGPSGSAGRSEGRSSGSSSAGSSKGSRGGSSTGRTARPRRPGG